MAYWVVPSETLIYGGLEDGSFSSNDTLKVRVRSRSECVGYCKAMGSACYGSHFEYEEEENCYLLRVEEIFGGKPGDVKIDYSQNKGKIEEKITNSEIF